MLYFAAALALGALFGALVVIPAMGRLARLVATPAPAPGSEDPVARAMIVVAAKDEAQGIEQGLRSLAAQIEPDLGVIAVDDRSTDGTSAILRRVADETPGIEAVRIDNLPPGWLGKNHALHVGAERAGAMEQPPEFLVFTDADVIFEPGAIRGALEHMEHHGLDHLTGAPRVEAESFALAGMIAAFGVLFGLFTRPWTVSRPKGRSYVGIGALNIVRRSMYLKAGGHRGIAMRIDDDLRLGRAMRMAGGRSEFAFATEIASIAWYRSLPEMMRGLHKNAFAGIDFRLSVAVMATLFLVAVFLSPFVLCLAPGVEPLTRALFAGTAGLHVIGASISANRAGLHPSAGLFFPVGVGLFLFVLWRSAAGALVTGRVVWRGTSYTLRELKAHRDGRLRRDGDQTGAPNL